MHVFHILTALPTYLLSGIARGREPHIQAITFYGSEDTMVLIPTESRIWYDVAVESSYLQLYRQADMSRIGPSTTS